MSRNILVVESENDKFFLEAFIRNFGINVEVMIPFCKIDEFECLEGDSLKKLTNALATQRIKAKKKPINNIGIILDHDDKKVIDRIGQMNKAIKDAFEMPNNDDIITSLGELASVKVDDYISINIGGYLQNVNGRGNLETVLKTIKNKNSEHADCLDSWKECIESKNLSIKDSDFNKFWVQLYQRYDQCSKKERKQAGRKCGNEASMRKDIWNFNHDCLKPLKEFLEKFK